MRRFVLSLLVLPLLLSGCAASDGASDASSAAPTTSETASESPDIVTPVASELEALSGTAITLAPGDFYDVFLPAGSADAWTAIVDTPGVVEWMPVEPVDDGSSVSTLATVGIGTTVVTLTDGATSVSFTVTVAQ